MSNNTMITLGENTDNFVEDVMLTVKDAVVATMGPNGKLALIASGTAVKATKDGVTVAKSIKFDDPRHELINKVITEAAIKTDTECGDGTTTTILLTWQLAALLKQYGTFRQQKFIEVCVLAIIEELKAMSIQITQDDPRLMQLALTSSNNDHVLSKVVTEIYANTVGHFPEIELREGISSVDKVVHSNGLPLNMYFANPGFSLHGNGADSTYDYFLPIIVDGIIGRGDNSANTLVEIHNRMQSIAGTKPVHLVVIARNIEHEACQVMHTINNRARAATATSNKAPVLFVAVNTSTGGSVGSLILGDYATLFGARMFTTLEDCLEANLPRPQMDLTIGSTRSMVTNMDAAAKQRVDARVAGIEKELGEYENADRFTPRAKFNEARIRNLKGQLVSIFVGGETNSDIKERTDRFEDVIKAVKSALVNGILPGIGTSLILAGRRALAKIIAEDTAERDPTPSGDGLREFLNLIPVFSTQGDEAKIVAALSELVHAPYVHLMRQVDSQMVFPKTIDWVKVQEVPPVVNLATGEEGTAETLGVYDTAFATITALKGGLQTGKILANTNALLLGEKFASVTVR